MHRGSSPQHLRLGLTSCRHRTGRKARRGEGHQGALVREAAGHVIREGADLLPQNWKTEDRASVVTVQAGVDSCFFPLYEIERGVTRITDDPESIGRRVPLSGWLKLRGKKKHRCKPGNDAALASI